MTNNPIIEVHQLSKVFKDFWARPKATALDNIDLTIPSGQVFALLGPNGSGKTTFIKCLLGLLNPTGGNIKIFGDNIFRIMHKEKIGLLPEASYFYNHLSGYETLNFYAKLLGLPKNIRKERIETLMNLTDMKQYGHRQIGDYSLGMQRRIGIAQALLADPELLILDEPTNGLDPIAVEKVHKLILKLKDQGKTILICTHLLAESEDICDYAAILYKGKLLASGELKNLYLQKQCSNIKDLFLQTVNSYTETQIASKTQSENKEKSSSYLDKISNN